MFTNSIDTMVPAADDSLPTRHSLLNRLKDWGDDRSWREFFETYWRLIYNFGRKSGLTDAEAQDAVQDTIIGVARKIEDFKTGAAFGSFKSWLMQQAYWRITDQFRKRSLSARSQSVDDLQSADDSHALKPRELNAVAAPELEQLWEIEWQEHIMRTALSRVKSKATVKQFQIFDLHVLQQLSVHQTAQVMGTTVTAVYMATSRLKRALKAELKAVRNAERPREM